MKLTLLLANVMNRFLGADTGANTNIKPDDYGNAPGWVQNMIAPIFSILEWLLPVIMILLGVAGVIYIIVVGVQYAKSETADQKDAAKKKLINIAVALIIMLVALIIVFIFIKNASKIFGWAAGGTVENGTWTGGSET